MTARYYGRGDELLDRYAWSLKTGRDQLWPCGMLKPNDRGLTDMLGNAYEWVQDERTFDLTTADVEGGLTIVGERTRALRGGSFPRPSGLRSAYRFWLKPGLNSITSGFRPARTCR